MWRADERGRDRPEIILIAAPPRHGKSTITSYYLPAWYLGTFPERRVVLASYESDFSATWAQKTRQLLEIADSARRALPARRRGGRAGLASRSESTPVRGL